MAVPKDFYARAVTRIKALGWTVVVDASGEPMKLALDAKPDLIKPNAEDAEIVLTCIFVLVVLGSTDEKKGAGNFAGLAIGLSLILIHLVGIHYTGTSVNPARSIGPALFEGGQAISDLWVFIVGPFVGAAIAAGVWKIIGEEK